MNGFRDEVCFFGDDLPLASGAAAFVVNWSGEIAAVLFRAYASAFCKVFALNDHSKAIFNSDNQVFTDKRMFPVV